MGPLKTRLLAGAAALLAPSADAAADLIIDSSSVYHYRAGYVIDDVHPGDFVYYDESTTDVGLNGSNSYDDGTASTSASSSFAGGGFDISMEVTAKVAVPGSSIAYTLAENHVSYTLSFHVDRDGLYAAGGSLETTRTQLTAFGSGTYQNFIRLYDSAAGAHVFETDSYISNFGEGTFGAIPATIALSASTTYTLSYDVSASSTVDNRSFAFPGAAAGAASLRFSLAPVPEPSSVAMLTIGGLGVASWAARCRKGVKA